MAICQHTPAKVFKIIDFLRGPVGEEALKRIATAPLDSLLRDQTTVELRNVVWGYAVTAGIYGHRGCELRYMKLSEWENRWVLWKLTDVHFILKPGVFFLRETKETDDGKTVTIVRIAEHKTSSA